MRQLRARSLIQLIIVAGLLLSTTCNLHPDSSIVKQLDQKARTIFNEKSSLVGSKSATREGTKLFYFEYESGLKTTLSLSSNILSVLDYEYGTSAKNSMAQKWGKSCN